MHQVGIFRAALILGCGALAACADRPVPGAPAAAPAAPAASQIYVVVERGQSLDRIAQAYRVATEYRGHLNPLPLTGPVLQMPSAVHASDPAQPRP